jgi:hypothetical protein
MTKRITGEGPNPSGLCLCGCGERTPLSTQSRSDRGDVLGTPVRYVLGHKRFPALSPVEYVEEDRGFESPCWIWQRSTDPKGYGRIGVGHSGSQLAHRALYERLVGPIPASHDLDHLCAVRCCVNPAHLEPVLHTENLRRARERAGAR